MIYYDRSYESIATMECNETVVQMGYELKGDYLCLLFKRSGLVFFQNNNCVSPILTCELPST